MSSYNPLVTIIIPVYNGENYLSEGIDSALAQTYKNLEIIVIDDGSNDAGATKRICLSYGDKITYYHKNNGGVSSALNYVLERSHGEWFSWLSHDDLYLPDKIKKQVDYINDIIKLPSSPSLDKIVIHTATESIDAKGKVIRRPSFANICEKEDTLDTIIGNVYNYRLSGCSFLLPYACYKEVGKFREDIRTVSDVDFWYRLLFGGYQFYCLKNDILVKNRSHGKQVGKTQKQLFDKEINRLYINIADKLYEYSGKENLKYMILFYFGLIKRNLESAAKYTKEKYLKNKVLGIKYFVIFPLKEVYWSFVGRFRIVARSIYRLIFVK